MKTSSPPLPTGVAWIGDTRHPPGDWRAAHFRDSDDFLLAERAYDFGGYVVELAQKGVRGLDLIRLIRRRSEAAIVALCRNEAAEFVPAFESGADLVLRADAPAEHLVAGLAAVRRRLDRSMAGAAAAAQPWAFLEAQGALRAPDGTQITLSESDVAIIGCFADAQGATVERRVLIERLWGPGVTPASTENALHATLYRLRKRIEQAGQPYVPVHAVARVGYEFRAPLVRAQG